MIIDNSTLFSDETIVLYPRSYNKRGEDRLHSVQGISADGREVNIKLRIDESMMGKESTPSITEFSREDVKAKHPCLASEDNGPDNREGVLLFTGCEFDGENRRKIPTYTARWGYVLASHSDASQPLLGLGRVVIDTESFARKKLQSEIDELEKEALSGWEAIVAHKKRQMNDPFQQSYYGQIYDYDAESVFQKADRSSIIEHAQSVFTANTQNGSVGGVLIRLLNGKGELVNEFSHEIFPRWRKGDSYQSAEQALGWFLSSNDQHLNEPDCHLALMPIHRYSCGAQFKNYYLQRKPEEAINKIKKNFLVNDQPTVASVAFVLSKREDTDERYLAKFYPITAPLCEVSLIGIIQDIQKNLWNDYEIVSPGLHSRALGFPAWFTVSGMGEVEPYSGLCDMNTLPVAPSPVLVLDAMDEDDMEDLSITDISTDVNQSDLGSEKHLPANAESDDQLLPIEEHIAEVIEQMGEEDAIEDQNRNSMEDAMLQRESSFNAPLPPEMADKEVEQETVSDGPAHLALFGSDADEDGGLNFSDIDDDEDEGAVSLDSSIPGEIEHTEVHDSNRLGSEVDSPTPEPTPPLETVIASTADAMKSQNTVSTPAKSNGLSGFLKKKGLL